MGNIGTERREVEFEPLEPVEAPVTQPSRTADPAPSAPVPERT
jgi:hypothetical protein